jgi:hypothetical protein
MKRKALKPRKGVSSARAQVAESDRKQLNGRVQRHERVAMDSCVPA